ncbi:MAG: hypothetical protein R6U20_10115, partial [Longimonas sp.]|uniref:hypothetical protein n=1 Tax=Longimonas sp. TaxID=2039626 RepID=UPI0039761E78
MKAPLRYENIPNQYPSNENERDDQLYAEIERKSREYNQRAGKEIFPPMNHVQNNQQQVNPNQQMQGDFQTNVVTVLENYFGDNFADTIRDVIVEIYTNDKMKQGIINNKNTVKEIVI